MSVWLSSQVLPLGKDLQSSWQPDPPQLPNTGMMVWRWRAQLWFSHARHALSGRRDSGWWASKYQKQMLNGSYECVMRVQLPAPTSWVKWAQTSPSPFRLKDLAWHLLSSGTLWSRLRVQWLSCCNSLSVIWGLVQIWPHIMLKPTLSQPTLTESGLGCL